MITTEWLTIDESLRLILFGLECALDVEFRVVEINRVFSDAREDQVSAKHYTFCDLSGTTVTGHVDEYEPESISLMIESNKTTERQVNEIIDKANHLARLLRHSF